MPNPYSPFLQGIQSDSNRPDSARKPGRVGSGYGVSNQQLRTDEVSARRKAYWKASAEREALLAERNPKVDAQRIASALYVLGLDASDADVLARATAPRDGDV